MASPRQTYRIGSGDARRAAREAIAHRLIPRDALEHFHDLDLVFYTRIGANIEGLTADKLAELAIGSAVAVRRGELEKSKDGISYLIAAKKNGIVAPLMPNSSGSEAALGTALQKRIGLPAALFKGCTKGRH
jgi:hypothetical protein